MNDEQTLRLAMAVSALIVIPIAISYRFRSRVKGERLDRRQEGWFILATLRPIGLAGMLGVIVYLINPAWMAWSSMPLPVWLRWFGAGLGAIGGILVILSIHSLGKNLTDTVVTRKAHTLVTAVPYRWIRHPFYVSVALSVIGGGLVAANWFILVTGGLAFCLLVLRTSIEERNLLSRFGDEYRAYMNRTGRFLPRIGKKAG